MSCQLSDERARCNERAPASGHAGFVVNRLRRTRVKSADKRPVAILDVGEKAIADSVRGGTGKTGEYFKANYLDYMKRATPRV